MLIYQRVNGIITPFSKAQYIPQSRPWLVLHPSNARFTSFMGVEAAAMAWVAAASTSDSVGNRVSAAGTWAWGVTLTWSRLAS